MAALPQPGAAPWAPLHSMLTLPWVSRVEVIHPRDTQLVPGTHSWQNTSPPAIQVTAPPAGLVPGGGHDGDGERGPVKGAWDPGWSLVGETGSAQGTVIPISVLPLRSLRLCLRWPLRAQPSSSGGAHGHDSVCNVWIASHPCPQRAARPRASNSTSSRKALRGRCAEALTPRPCRNSELLCVIPWALSVLFSRKETP